jgi:hypothetical protein
MAKKHISFRLSEENIAFLLQHGKGNNEAIENILKKLRALEQNQPQQSEKIVEKPVYKGRLEELQIQCIFTHEYVNLAEKCQRNCKDFNDCPYYYSIVAEKKIPRTAKLKMALIPTQQALIFEGEA